MRINSVPHISFKSIPIYDVKVKKKEGLTYKNVDATFSRLNPYDNNDVAAINKIRKKWNSESYTGEIAENFRNPGVGDLFFAVELKGDEPLSKRIVSLCETCPYLPSIHIDFLQSRDKSYIDIKKEGDIKGGGEVLLYGITRAAKTNCLDRIYLSSAYTAIDFYKHIGFKNSGLGTTSMELENPDFDSFMARVEEKYDFTKDEEQ